MKKEGNIGFVYFLVFAFLALCIFGGLGFYNNITGATIDTGRIGNSLQGAIQIITLGLVKPIFGELIGQSSDIIIRVILWIILFSLISGVLTKNQNLNKTTANVISALIPLMGVSFLPEEFIKSLGPIGAFLIVLGLVIFGYKWIYSFEKDNLNWFSKTIKIILALLMIVFLSIMTPWFENVFGAEIGDLYYMAITLGIAMGAILIVYFLVFLRNKNEENDLSGTLSEPDTRRPNILRGTLSYPQPEFSERGNAKERQEQQTRTPQQQPQTSNKKQIKQIVDGYYSQMQTAHVSISNEFDKPNPNIQVIKKNLEIINKYSRSIITALTDSGLQGDNFNAVLFLARSINTSSNRLNDKDIDTLKKNYKRVIGQALPNMRWPITGL